MAGVVEQVGGSALGSQYNSLYGRIEEMMTKNTIYRSVLEDLKSKLDSLQQLFQKMAQHNKLLQQSRTEELEELRSQMEQGAELVQKCSKLRPWETFKKFKYANKLRDLNESLQRLLNALNIEVARDVQQSMVSLMINTEAIFKTKGVSELPKPPSFIVGLDAPLTEVKMKLLNDGVSMLVLTGPGGCGKTTLATMFCKDEEVKEKFEDNIFFVTISKKPNYETIVEQLHQRKGSQVPIFHNNDIAVTLLQQFLNEEGKNPLLLVLDDAWPGAESHIQKCYDVKMPNYKILVTSRSEFPRFGSPYCLKSLNEENAMTLFHYSASLADKSSYIPENLSRKIVEHCKGFPLAITMVGRSLCGQPVEMWQKRVIEWSKGSIFDSESELLLCFQSSLDALETGLKECFMDLGSFPLEYKISVAALVDMWIELYDVEDEVYCITNIHQLTARNLANIPRKVEMDGDGYYSDQFVTQHDLLRELAIYQTRQQDPGQRERLIIDISGDNTPKWWRDQKILTMKARLVSISTDGMFSMKWHNMQLPEAQVLVLNFEANYALPEFVETMDRLTVMILINHGPLPVELSNFQLLGSLSYLKIIRLEHISIASITNNPIQLKSLQKISFFMCGIGQAFINCPIKISDAFPNLEEMEIDHCNDLVELPDELCDLIYLKRLCITNCSMLSALPEEIGELVRLEILRLRSCRDLRKLPKSIKNLKKLNLLDISGCFSITELQDNFNEMSSLRTINMRQCSSLQKLPPSLDLQQLEEVICDEDTKALWEPFLPNPKVRMLNRGVNSEI